MTKMTLAISLVLSMALAPLSLAFAETAKHHTKRSAARVVQQQKIACTKYGCFPIARNCTPYGQLDWRGNPTGYDGIACR